MNRRIITAILYASILFHAVGCVDTATDPFKNIDLGPIFGDGWGGGGNPGNYAGAAVTVEPSSISPGDSIIVRWTGVNARRCFLSSFSPLPPASHEDPVQVELSGWRVFRPAVNTVYQVHVENQDGTDGPTVEDSVRLSPWIFKLSTRIAGNGSVLRDSAGDDYLEGTSVTLTAVPDSGWSLYEWSMEERGVSTPTENPLRITMDANLHVTATFLHRVGSSASTH